MIRRRLSWASEQLRRSRWAIKREGTPADTPWTKVKFDRQIVATAIVNDASEIVYDDPHVKAIGDRWGIKVTSVEDSPIPSELIPPPLLAGLEDEPDGKKLSRSPLPFEEAVADILKIKPELKGALQQTLTCQYLVMLAVGSIEVEPWGKEGLWSA